MLQCRFGGVRYGVGAVRATVIQRMDCPRLASSSLCRTTRAATVTTSVTRSHTHHATTLNDMNLHTGRLFHHAARRLSAAANTAAPDEPSKRVSYTHTMLLPRTSFTAHVVSPSDRELQLQSICGEAAYQWQLQQRPAGASTSSFILHDGPPFANGQLHLGHFLNKVLKDFINRYQMLKGNRVEFIPGWDCHGLPIEVKAIELLQQQRQQATAASSEDKGKSGKKKSGKQSASAAAAAAASDQSLSAAEVRALARSFANHALDAQRRSFRRWGIWGSWDDPYITMDPSYEAAQMDVFRRMMQRGMIFRGLKPVYWSPVSRTALAEAELEYVDEHVSPSLYVSFSMQQLSAKAQERGLSLDKYPGLAACIWTTTPWTLPSNLALCVHQALDYYVVRIGKKVAGAESVNTATKSGDMDSKPDASSSKQTNVTEAENLEGRYFLFGKDRLDTVVRGEWKHEYEVLLTVSGEDLAGSVARHPFLPRDSPLLHAEHVTTDAGTCLVHTAPGHGMEDFNACKENGINDVLCPVDAGGNFTKDVGVPELEGHNVLKGANKEVIKLLASKGTLVHAASIKHRFPYDWRSKTPVMQRATEQWFCALDTIQSEALSALSNVSLIPAAGRARLQGMVEKRKEWCISRQRAWGLPIPAFYDETSNEVIMNDESVQHVIELIRQHGSDCWWTMPIEQLLPPTLRNNGHKYRRGMDTMDVWFDSGCSWSAVVQHRLANQQQVNGDKQQHVQADVYLEGSDQHRGWFQSSLLTSVAATGQAPYKAVITHGFVLDEKLRKMSKSLGNVIDPHQLITGMTAEEEDAEIAARAATNSSSDASTFAPSFSSPSSSSASSAKDAKAKRKAAASSKKAVGIDVLRLWVASSDIHGDISVGPTIIAKSGENIKKLRSVASFMLGCIDDLQPSSIVPYSSLSLLDRYQLHLLHSFVASVTSSYDSYNFREVFMQLSLFNSQQLSSFYFDINKDILYAESKDSHTRRSVQTVLLHALIAVTKTIAPILPHTAEDIYQHVPQQLRPLFSQPSSPAASADTHSPSASSSSPSTLDSIFTHGLLSIPDSWHDPSLFTQVEVARRVRSHVMKLLEKMRKEHKKIGHFSEAQIDIEVAPDSDMYAQLQPLGDELNLLMTTAKTNLIPTDAAPNPSSPPNDPFSMLVSETDSVGESTSLLLRFRPADGIKCPRCRKFHTDHAHHDECCKRCSIILDELQQAQT